MSYAFDVAPFHLRGISRMNDYDVLAAAVAFGGLVLLIYGLQLKSQSLSVRIGRLILASCCILFAVLHFSNVYMGFGPRVFANQDELLKAQADDRYVVIGRFDESWPATYIDEIASSNEISFASYDGTPQQYSGFDGYKLKVVRLLDKAGRQPMFVLRSQAKQ